jgi:hypothetical protein
MTEEQIKTQEEMDGSPSHVTGNGFDIKFQCGPIKEVGANGCQVDDILNVLITRLKGFDKGPFRSRENSVAITKLEEAQMWLERRTKNRVARGVEGENKPHN